MANTSHTRLSSTMLPRRSITAKAQHLRGSVRQDNPARPPAPSASPQPAPRENRMRPAPSKAHPSRIHQKLSNKRNDVKLDLWVKPRVKAELQRIAREKGLSVSTTGEALLENALQQNLYAQHTALLDPIINKAIGRHMRAYSTRLALLLVRNAYASEQTRNIVTNILSRQPGVDPDILTTILDGSSKAAKRNITHRTPQLREIIEEFERFFRQAGEGEGDG
jgi:hypothetical protein